MKTEVIRSHRRKRTVQASVVDGVLRIRIPAYFDRATEEYWVEKMTKRVTRSRSCDSIDLAERAARLAATHHLPTPKSITWSSRQTTLWGSCTPSAGTVRISDRIAVFPPWVVDYVIVHELAHLSVPAHSDGFWELVMRYPLAERARGYLLAKSDGAAMAHQSGED